MGTQYDGSDQAAHSAERAEGSGSAYSERDAAHVTLNLVGFHDAIEARRADAVQHACTACDVDQIPPVAVLAAGSLSVRPTC